MCDTSNTLPRVHVSGSHFTHITNYILHKEIKACFMTIEIFIFRHIFTPESLITLMQKKI